MNRWNHPLEHCSPCGAHVHSYLPSGVSIAVNHEVSKSRGASQYPSAASAVLIYFALSRAYHNESHVGSLYDIGRIHLLTLRMSHTNLYRGLSKGSFCGLRKHSRGEAIGELDGMNRPCSMSLRVNLEASSICPSGIGFGFMRGRSPTVIPSFSCSRRRL